jgi:hypothetical protein
MSDIDGVAITEITGFGCSDDGQHIWLTHKLRDGSEYRLVYRYGAAGHLITLFSHAARSASERRATVNPQEAAEGFDSDVIPVEEVRVGTLPDDEGAILHLTTADNLPIAVGLSPAVLSALIDQLQHIAEIISHPAPKRQLH